MHRIRSNSYCNMIWSDEQGNNVIGAKNLQKCGRSARGSQCHSYGCSLRVSDRTETSPRGWFYPSQFQRYGIMVSTRIEFVQRAVVGVVNINRLDIELICVCVHPYKRSENLSTPRIGVTLTLVASMSVAKPAAGEKKWHFRVKNWGKSEKTRIFL